MRVISDKVRAVFFAMAASLLSACGGGGGSGNSNTATPAGGVNLQVVSFGDSLSDVGTYAPIASAVGGGRFTTNPGQVWSQDVAQYYGDTLNAAYTIDVTHKLSAQNGLGYAEGGSTVATPANQYDFLTDVIGNIEMPVNQQVSSYLSAHGSFNSNQLILVWAGANDVLRAGTLPTAASTVETAATTLAQLVGQIVQNGGTHVVVINLPNIGLSPKGLAASDGGANLTQLSAATSSSLRWSASHTRAMWPLSRNTSSNCFKRRSSLLTVTSCISARAWASRICRTSGLAPSFCLIVRTAPYMSPNARARESIDSSRVRA